MADNWNVITEEIDRINGRVSRLKAQFDEHRGNSTPCLLGKACKKCLALVEEIDALSERMQELNRRRGGL